MLLVGNKLKRNNMLLVATNEKSATHFHQKIAYMSDYRGFQFGF